MSHEHIRLEQANQESIPWKKWGPYLSERQWGTVREDYSTDGNAWGYFTHDQARSRAYRWGEDGLAGFSDEKARLCFALGLWNGVDPILKERLFGLSNSEANHGEDVKEYYYYLDSTPTHSYMKYLYKYPQAPFPYDKLVKTNSQRSRQEFEYELMDTGVFDQDRYFDVFVEYAKETPEDILIQITAWNRAPEAAVLYVLPTLWFRNTWDWYPFTEKPLLYKGTPGEGFEVIAASHPELGARYLYCEAASSLLFTENETNQERLFGLPNPTPFVKDGIHNYLVHNQVGAVNPLQKGTRAAPCYKITISPGEQSVVRLRLSDTPPSALKDAYGSGQADPFGDHFRTVFEERRSEADEFYDSITPVSLGKEQVVVMRQALAGLLWTKQYYYFDVDRWLEEHESHPLLKPKRKIRNSQWYHMVNDDIISMPDKWEYPWYAAWDLAFHTLPLSMVDPAFAKQQLRLVLQEVYLHPNGQIPAYEWNFGDVNPPVHAWAAKFVYDLEKQTTGKGDLVFLEEIFQKLLLNFNWWVNRKDPLGKNVFEGGFLGLDNIGVFDRSSKLPNDYRLEQADGTAWMAMYCQNMLDIAIELTLHNPSYEGLVLKFVEHFLWIAGSMDRMGENQDELWDEETGFFYDVLILPDGSATRMKVNSMVGLLPLCASLVINAEALTKMPDVIARLQRRINKHPELLANIHPPAQPGVNGRRLLSAISEDKLRRILGRMLDENRFLSPYGIRSLSRFHLEHPYQFKIEDQEYGVQYLPAESDTGMFGGNSNWRGPIWFPVNTLIIRTLLQFYRFYGDEFKVECPTGSGKFMNLFEVSREISRRLERLFLPDEGGRRPVYGGSEKFQTDPHWRDYILFYEYFHGDNGAGLGASHQTGWTGIVARLMEIFAKISAEDILQGTVSPLAVPALRGTPD
jgi:hypothetical protein